MKKLVFLAVAALMMTACATQKLTPEEKEAKRQAKQAEVLQLIKSHYFVTPMRTMHYSIGGSKQIDYGYNVTVKGDKLISYLPYIGYNRKIGYSSEEGLNFTAAITDYRIDRPRKDANRVQLVAATPNNIYIFIFLVYDDGNVQLSIRNRDKEETSFSGEIEPYKED